MQYTPLQSEQMLVQTMPYCLHVQFFRAQSILQQLFLTALVVLLVWSFRSALFLVSLAVNPILRDPAHSSLSTLVSYDICKAHIAVHHLEWVQEVQLSWNVESVLTFSHGIYVHEAHQEFSPSCHLAEEVEFSLQLAICLFCLMLMKRSSIDFGIIDFSKMFVILYVI